MAVSPPEPRCLVKGKLNREGNETNEDEEDNPFNRVSKPDNLKINCQQVEVNMIEKGTTTMPIEGKLNSTVYGAYTQIRDMFRFGLDQHQG